MTLEERNLRDALQTHAAHMANIVALLEILADWDVYADASLCEDARHRRRMRTLSMLESVAHLAQFYHDDALRIAAEAAQEER